LATAGRLSDEKGAAMTISTPPENPAGAFIATELYDAAQYADLVQSLRQAPRLLREAVDGLNPVQLDTKYKNWTIRQITHHIADSHVHSYIRFKWALTEENPTIKAYEEGDWVSLDDNRRGDVEPALQLADGLHAKWVQVLESLTPADYARTFHHPQSGETVSLWTALNYYPWHAKHHTAQILWLRDQHGW
jgi:hypothetical protein